MYVAKKIPFDLQICKLDQRLKKRFCLLLPLWANVAPISPEFSFASTPKKLKTLKSNFVGKFISLFGQRFWLSWQGSCFGYQWSLVQIKSSAILLQRSNLLITVGNTKIKKKEAYNGLLQKCYISLFRFSKLRFYLPMWGIKKFKNCHFYKVGNVFCPTFRDLYLQNLEFTN